MRFVFGDQTPGVSINLFCALGRRSVSTIRDAIHSAFFGPKKLKRHAIEPPNERKMDKMGCPRAFKIPLKVKLALTVEIGKKFVPIPRILGRFSSVGGALQTMRRVDFEMGGKS
ncbi:hypothetical protein [Antarctobacter jejuensis]|uniref:hypothetical protein n=1 Tax=Antarctobacter jejuensis TaxID=1439938 RepID=UPI003FD0835B